MEVPLWRDANIVQYSAAPRPKRTVSPARAGTDGVRAGAAELKRRLCELLHYPGALPRGTILKRHAAWTCPMIELKVSSEIDCHDLCRINVSAERQKTTLHKTVQSDCCD